MPDPFMSRALQLASAHLGQTWPNPCVGAVIVKDGRIVGEAAKGGRPHAEPQALAQAGTLANGATLYVTLEPCSHHGKTPPCTDAIINSGITKCIIACRDPNPHVRGSGVEILREAGITVIEGPCSDAAHQMHRGFFSVIEKNRPFIAMKIATSADGKIASAPGVNTIITGETARHHAQALRAEFDAILTGIGTVLADDPLLTVRIPGMEHRSPVRVVLDSHHRLPAASRLRQTENDVPLWVFGRTDNVIEELTGRGITRLLIEAGHEVNSYFLKNGLVDRIYWYQSPHALGETALDVAESSIKKRLHHWLQHGEPFTLGEDRLVIVEKEAQ